MESYRSINVCVQRQNRPKMLIFLQESTQYIVKGRIPCLRETFKNPNHGFVPWWGGGTPPCRDWKICWNLAQKQCFLGKKRRFWWKNSKPRAVMGGGVPPLAVIFFAVTFWPAACRYGGRGGGYPPNGTKPRLGFLNNSLTDFFLRPSLIQCSGNPQWVLWHHCAFSWVKKCWVGLSSYGAP